MLTITPEYKDSFISHFSLVSDAISKKEKKHVYLVIQNNGVTSSIQKSDCTSFKNIIHVSKELVKSKLLDETDKQSLKTSLEVLAKKISSKKVPWYLILTLIGIPIYYLFRRCILKEASTLLRKLELYISPLDEEAHQALQTLPKTSPLDNLDAKQLVKLLFGGNRKAPEIFPLICFKEMADSFEKLKAKRTSNSFVLDLAALETSLPDLKNPILALPFVQYLVINKQIIGFSFDQTLQTFTVHLTYPNEMEKENFPFYLIPLTERVVTLDHLIQGLNKADTFSTEWPSTKDFDQYDRTSTMTNKQLNDLLNQLHTCRYLQILLEKSLIIDQPLIGTLTSAQTMVFGHVLLLKEIIKTFTPAPGLRDKFIFTFS